MVEQAPRSARRIFGTALMAVGALMAGLSGLCTLGYAGLGIAAWATEGDDYGLAMLIVALLSGIVPILVGVGLYFAGKALRRPTPGV